MILLGISGKARVGKDTAALHLLDHWGLEPMSFAAPIKVAVQQMFGLDERHLNGDLKEVPIDGIGKSPRQLFQTLGTEWGRERVHPDVWLHVAGVWLRELEVRGLRSGNRMFGAVFSDVRFENEARWIRERGGMVLHISRDEAQEVAAHVSESGIAVAKNDISFSNNGSIDELHYKLDQMMEALLAAA